MELSKRESKVLNRFSDEGVKSSKRIVVFLCGLLILICLAKVVFWRNVSQYDYLIWTLFLACILCRDLYVRDKIILFLKGKLQNNVQ